MKKFIVLLWIVSVLFGCGTIQTHTFQVETGITSAIVEVDGVQVCKSTPCDIELKAELTFVGIAYSPDGYECSGSHHISVFPISSDVNPPYAKSKKVEACEYSESSKTVDFDLNVKPEELISRGKFLKSYNQIRYFSLGSRNNRWHFRKNPLLDSKSHDFTITYGQEIYRRPWNLFLGELVLGKINSFESSQYLVGAIVHGNYMPLSMVYYSGGLFYNKFENEFTTDGVFPYFGVGLLLNHKTFLEFWHVFKGVFAKREDFTYQVGEFSYDFFIGTGAYLHGKDNWDAQDFNMGLRVYY